MSEVLLEVRKQVNDLREALGELKAAFADVEKAVEEGNWESYAERLMQFEKLWGNYYIYLRNSIQAMKERIEGSTLDKESVLKESGFFEFEEELSRVSVEVVEKIRIFKRVLRGKIARLERMKELLGNYGRLELSL